MTRRCGRLAVLAVFLTAAAAPAGEDGWTVLVGTKGLDAWRQPTGAWLEAGGAGLDPANPQRLAPQPGNGVLINGRSGRTDNLVSKEKFGDVEIRLEFLVPKGSNSGVKLQ